MSDMLQLAAKALQDSFYGEVSEYQGNTRVFIQKDHIVTACELMRDKFQFEMLADLTAVDYWPEMEPRYHVVYQLRSVSNRVVLTLKVPISGNEEEISSIESVYPNANWYERELFDMFGIHIAGHSDLRRILMPHDWQGHPLRKDYPLGYEEVQFSFNAEEIDKKKPYVNE